MGEPGAQSAPNDRGCAYRTVPVCRRKWLSSSSPAEKAVLRSEPLDEQVKQHSPCGYEFFAVQKSSHRESLELAEWPCFVLPSDGSRKGVRHYVELHRMALSQASGRSIEADSWQVGFQLALRDLILNRYLEGRPEQLDRYTDCSRRSFYFT